MKRRHIVLSVIVTLALFHSAQADTVILKDGKKLEGQILSQTDTEIVIEYSVTHSIKDQKTLTRDQILKIDALPKDDKAFADLGDLSSPPTVLNTSFYDLLIDNKIPEFLAQYSYSRHISELREDVRLLESERSRVRQGDRKINGAWITAAQIQNDPYGFGAMIKFSGMKELAATNDPVGALRSYELIEKNYPGSEVMPDALDLGIKQIGVLQGNLNSAKANFPVIEKTRQDAIAQAPADQAKQLKESIEKENTAAKGSMSAAAADGSKFFPVFPNNKDALEALQSLINSENARLLKLQALGMRDGIKATAECAKLLAEGKTKEAQEQLGLSIKLWPANIQNTKLQQQLNELTKAQAAASQKPTSTPVTPKP